MIKLTKEQRDRILMVAAGTLVVLGLLWYFLISAQRKSLQVAQKKVTESQGKVDQATRLISRAGLIKADLEDKMAELRQIEDGMAAGDIYAWEILTINRFKAGHRVEIPNITREQVGDVGLMPSFPYKAATFTINGSALFHDYGKFAADFENQFKYFRIQNIELWPAPAARADEARKSEELEFQMEIAALIKPKT